MLKTIFFILLVSSIISDEIKEIIIKDDDPITDKIDLITKAKIYKIKYEGNKKYIEVKVSSELNNPYIIYCQKKECSSENAFLLSNLREKEQSLFIKNQFLVEKEGYLEIFSYEESLQGNVIFSATDIMLLNRDTSISYFSNNDDDNNVIKIPKENSSEKIIMTLSFYVSNQENVLAKFYYFDGNEKHEIRNVLELNNAKVVTFDESEYSYKENSYYSIESNQIKNSYVTINSKVFKNEKSTFKANSLALLGVLNNYLNTQCFTINNSKSSKSNSELKLHFHIMSLSGSIQYYFDKESPRSKTSIDYDIAFTYSKNDLENSNLCIQNQKESNSAYFLEIIDFDEETNKTNFYTPQINGKTYSRITLPKKLVYFNFAQRAGYIYDKYTFYLKVKKGNPIMYRAECKTYPKCIYSFDEIDRYISIGNFTKSKTINVIYYNLFKVNSKEILSYYQNLLAIGCYGDIDCEYETLIYGQNDGIILKNSQRFVTFLQKGLTNVFQFEITDPSIHTVIFAVYTFTGNTKVESNTLYVSNLLRPVYINKQEFNYHKENLTDSNNLIGKYNFNVEAINNSFFTVEYRVIPLNQKIQYINAGITYIETIDLNGSREIWVNKLRNETNKNYYASFLSLNCKVTIKKLFVDPPKTILEKGYFVSDEILSSEEEYKEKYIKYLIKAESLDSTRESESELCMIYISSTENTFQKTTQKDDNHIMIGENIKQNVVLSEKTKGIKFLYPFAKIGDLLLNFDFSNQGNLHVNVDVEGDNYIIKDLIVSQTQTHLIKSESFTKCENTNELCKIFIELYAEENDLKQSNMKFAFSVKSEEDTPSYLKKGLMKTDVISGKSNIYYYSDVSKGEEGEILINFERGTGDIYARIVEKDISAEQNPNWMGRIHLPKKGDDNLLIVDEYSNKIYYFKSDTERCGKVGCFLLINIVNSVERIIEGSVYLYDISVMARVTNGKRPQVIDVYLDRFIINIIPSKEESLSDFYHYYTFTLDTDVSVIYLELQSDLTILYVNEGEEIPKYKNAKYTFNPLGINNIFEIKEGLKAGTKFIVGVGVYRKATTIMDHIYSLRIRAPPLNKIDLIPVDSDQNTLCKFTEGYCYFHFHFKKADILKDAYIHVFQDKFSSLEIYAKNLTYEETLKKESLPSKTNYILSSKNQLNKDYLLINLMDLSVKAYYLIIAVTSDKPGIITLLSTLYTYTQRLNIDASAYQLFHTYEGLNLTLRFPVNNMYIAHFVSVEGIGKIYNTETKSEHYLKGNFDILGMVIPVFSARDIIVSSEKGNFGFYVYYEPRNAIINFDEIDYATSGQIFYDNSSFPLFIYCQVPKDFGDTTVIINLKNDNLNVNDSSVVDLSFYVKGYVADRDFIMKKKIDSGYNPEINKLFDGQFDFSFRIAKVHFTKERIEKEKGEIKYLCVILYKGNDQKEYNGITAEYSVFPLNSKDYNAPYDQYIFGNLKEENNTQSIYKLRRNNDNDNYIRVEFSSNFNDQINIALMKKIPSEKKYENNTEIEEKGLINGKSTFIVKMREANENLDEIYLIVYSNNPSASNFAFKYDSAHDQKSFPNYIISDTLYVKSTKSDKEPIVNLTLKTINKSYLGVNKSVSVTYIAKVIDKSNNTNSNFGNIIFSNETVIKVYKKVYKGNTNNTDFSMELKDFPNNKEYDVIVTAITNEDSSEIFFYGLIKNPLDKKSQNYAGGNKVLIIILIVIIVSLIGVFGFLFIKMKKENSDLHDKINQMSGYNLTTDENNEDLNYQLQK